MNFNGNVYEMKPMDPKQKKRLQSIAVLVVVILVLIILVTQSVYTVPVQDQAVITTFGRHTSTSPAGLHFKLPFIQQVHFVPVNVSLRQTIGYHPDTEARIASESKMITGDFNIINIDFYMEYRILDPYKFLFNSQEPEKILRNIAQSKIRNVISTYRVDPILTGGQAEIQTEIFNLITEDLNENYDIGLVLTNIIIQDAEPPTPEVIAAFKSVETARQDRLTASNRAQAYSNERLPTAEAEANQLTENAEFIRANRVNEANMLVAMFNAMFSEYAANPSIHKQRMYFEMIEQVLPGMKVYINTGNGENVDINLLVGDLFNNDIE